jgi:hypothetical protein
MMRRWNLTTPTYQLTRQRRKAEGVTYMDGKRTDALGRPLIGPSEPLYGIYFKPHSVCISHDPDYWHVSTKQDGTILLLTRQRAEEWVNPKYGGNIGYKESRIITAEEAEELLGPRWPNREAGRLLIKYVGHDGTEYHIHKAYIGSAYVRLTQKTTGHSISIHIDDVNRIITEMGRMAADW